MGIYALRCFIIDVQNSYQSRLSAVTNESPDDLSSSFLCCDPFVYVSRKRLYWVVKRSSRPVMVKKSSKKLDASAEFLFCFDVPSFLKNVEIRRSMVILVLN